MPMVQGGGGADWEDKGGTRDSLEVAAAVAARTHRMGLMAASAKSQRGTVALVHAGSRVEAGRTSTGPWRHGDLI
jgi:hypothetical protein